MGESEFSEKAHFILVVVMLLIIPDWFDYEREIGWLITFESWGFRMLAFPVLVLLFIRESKAFKWYAVLTFFTLFSNVSDLGFIDEYDQFFLTIKIILWIACAKYVIEYYFRKDQI